MLYENLFDIEKRPGAGVALWTKAVERQLQRVRDANYRHRLHNSPSVEEQRDDPDATDELHTEVYFLAMAIRRVLLFHDAFAKQVADPRLNAARVKFDGATPNARELRNFLEHLDQYLVDDPGKHMDIPGRAAPILNSRWDSDNVVVVFGPLRLDVTLAAVAAIELGRLSASIWDEHLERVKAEAPSDEPPPTDDGIPRVLEASLGVSSIIGGPDESRRSTQACSSAFACER